MSDNINRDIDEARALLSSGGFTCVLKKGKTAFSSREKGVKPLLDFIDAGDNFSGFSAADKIVGKAAALLYVKMGVKAVYGEVMGRAAVSVFEKFAVYYEYGELTDAIINRAGTGLCPMEEAVAEIDEPEAAVAAIKSRLALMGK